MYLVTALQEVVVGSDNIVITSHWDHLERQKIAHQHFLHKLDEWRCLQFGLYG